MFTQRIASILKDISEGRVSREEGLRRCHAIRAEARAASAPAPVGQRERGPVAVIGMAGRYPQAADLSQFWHNLSHGVDCVTEVPAGRWDAARGPYRSGGFLEDVDRFDAAFFNIAPREAERMDPQERLFLETAWSALEDGGYTRRSLQEGELPGNVGVFVGVTYQEYQLYGAEQQVRGQQTALAGIAAGVANRVSYFCNFHGPSISIDTMCSSSLTALHLAVQSLQAGECGMALAGGVNLSIHPNKYLVLSQGQFVSSRGRCESFGADGDGYVPAEGVGCLLLKPLDAAVRDGDRILGVIRGTSVNHGGKTNGYTVPNPHAQASVIRRAMATAGIAPGEVSYLEAHGTGTSLGDPIEIAGLSQAYGDEAGQLCAIGSVKSNIGHCEAAAGVAGVTKVLLQLQHRTLVPSLHAERLNPNIDFDATPFRVQRSTAAWNPPGGRRVAGISSFGAGGSNAHVLIEEWVETRAAAPVSDEPAVIVLSAQNQDRLRQAAMRLREYLDRNDAHLADVAYTLQVGREAMECRLACIARSIDDVRSQLDAWLKHPSMAKGVFLGVGNREVPTRGGTRGRPDLASQIDAALAGRAPEAIARLWAQGGAVDWPQWYSGPLPRRVSLPTYPFDRSQRHWFDSYQKPVAPRSTGATVSLPVELSLISARLIDDSIAFVMMHDRAQRNQMAGVFVDELERIFTAISTDERVKVVVLAGYDEVFCLGGTKDALVGISEGRLKYSDVPFVYRGLLDCPVPVIAAMEGHAVGGGLAFGCQADIVYLAAESVYGANFMQFGFTPGMGGTLFFREKFGANLAHEMMFSADSLTGQALKEKGAPLTVIPRAQVLQDAMARARSLAAKPRNALTLLKQTMAQRLLDQLPRVVAEELAMHDETITRADVRQTIEQRIDRLESLGDTAGARQEPVAPQLTPVAMAAEPAPTDVPAIEARIRAIVAHLLHMDPAHVRAESTFQDMGVDSIAAVELARDVNAEFGLSLDAVVLYDCPTVAKYARHVAEQMGRLQASVASARATAPAPVEPAPVVAAAVVAAPVVAAAVPTAPARAKVVLSATPAAPVVRSAPARTPIALEPTVGPAPSRDREPSVPPGIAVIGMAGRFPGAANLDEFWRNLSQGINSVSEVPASRWSIDAVYDPRPMQPNKTYSRWGGFLDGVDEFDPLFFSLSPAEAAQMDPQQRLFLQTAWHAIEDAGYDAGALAGTACGVFVGVGQGDYLNVLNAAQETPGAQSLLGNTCSMLSGRIAYFLDLKGPNMAIDTACSSSLVALHQACRSIWAGECETALAGGVYVMTTPMMHVMTSRGAMLSPTGQCRAFDQDADGFVLAEGVGVLLLKRLDRAERDGDHIYGVIRGSAVNYDGATNGITAPSAVSQEQLEAGVYREFAIPVSAIGLVEAHGTGTKLGDPIEVKALTRAFRQSTAAAEYCALGSVKSNIGHALAAAGIAGAIKALLCLSHRKLVPTLHYDRLNEHIPLEGSPFFVNTEFRDWIPSPGAATRFAALSSFGLSGTNAHMVFEEYPRTAASSGTASGDDEHLLVVSAKTQDGLRRRMADLAAWAETHEGASIADVAFTLSAGRRHFDHRCAVVARSVSELAAAMRSALEGRAPSSVLIGQGARPDAADLAIYREVLRQTIEGRKLLTLAGMYVKGFDVPWAEVWAGVPRRRVPLPLYPFERERCWPDVPVPAPAAHAPRHTQLRADDPCVADHQVLGRPVLPAVAILELVRAAAEAAGLGPVVALRDVTWTRPVIVDGAATVTVQWEPTPDGTQFALLCDGERCARGAIVTGPQRSAATPPLDLHAIGARCDREIDVSECYARLADAGIVYGPTFRTLTRLRSSGTEVIADLRRARPGASVLDRGVLPPGVLDGALQAGLGLVSGGNAAPARAAIPFALQELVLHGAVPDEAHAHVTRTASGAFHITLTDATGRVCLEFRELVTRPASAATGQVLTLVPRWAAEPLPPQGGDARPARTLVLTSTVREYATSVDATERLTLSERPHDPTTWCAGLFAALKTRLQAGLSAPYEFLVLVSEDDDPAQVAALTGLLRTAALENPLVHARLLIVPAGPALSGVRRWLAQEDLVSTPGFTEARWNAGAQQREVRRVQEVALPRAGTSPFRPDGVYWITGGAGGLGLLTARHLSRMSGVTIVLSSRGEATVAVHETVAALSAAGARVSYLPCDVTSLESVAAVRDTIVRRFGRLTGVFHSAGVIRDAFILKKDARQVQEVLAPKVAGLLNLLRATEADPPDLLVVYSAAAGTLGNLGQCDYAAANAFMDAVAEAHPGRLVSIGWPLWADGGMQVDAETRSLMRTAAGITPLPTDVAFETLEAICAARLPRVLVLHGHADTMRRTLVAPQTTAGDDRPAASVAAGDVHEAAVIAHLRSQLARPLKLAADRIDVTRSFEEYGIDSVMVLEVTAELERDWGPLPRTLFFEYPHVTALARHLLSTYPEKAAALVSTPGSAVASPVVSSPVPAPAPEPVAGHRDIAIIGLAGRYPQADTLEDFWRNLQAGRDSITEIPLDRWDHTPYYDALKNGGGKVRSKWGGFLSRVDEFDPYFFNISPLEAGIMDPQERVMLEAAWEAMEDAGYRRDLEQRRAIGVYVGVMYSEYQLHGAAEQAQGRPIALSGSPASIANRVSYVLNLHGPSLAVDSMCSSSLTAVHLACQALAAGQIEMALAGGVNLSLHPNKYLLLGQGQFVSSKGRCESFGVGGDGYVPGEGVGCVVLKPLERALADRDHIYGVIKATTLNHGGKTNGYTVPNPAAQAEVIRAAIREAGVAPGDISYVEAHGTGTSLGDPVEIEGLRQAFGGGDGGRRCAIGSVKSNIGHCESAAGMAGLTKILLQMAHGQLVPSLHSRELNPHIDFARTPFVVQQHLAPWTGAPRIAGLSSFGAGGSNAHLILSDWPAPVVQTHTDTPVIITLSARTDEQLRAVVTRFRDWMADPARSASADLVSIAFTLQQGREAMARRLAFVASNRSAVREACDAWLEGRPLPAAGSDALQAMADGWMAGQPQDWAVLYRGVRPSRVSLPTYPFARERFWFPRVAEVGTPVTPAVVTREHTIAAGESWLGDHRVHGQPVVPGVAYLQMVIDAATSLTPAGRAVLSDIMWVQPLVVTGTATLRVTLTPSGDGYEFEVTSAAGVGDQTHCRGSLTWAGESPDSPPVDIARVQAALSPVIASDAGQSWYDAFAGVGLSYGPAYRTITQLWGDETRSLALVETAAAVPQLDAALQAVAGVRRDTVEGTPLPFAITTFAPPTHLPSSFFVTVVKVADDRYDCDWIAPDGTVLGRIRGLTMRTSADVLSGLTYVIDWKDAPVAEHRPESPDSRGRALVIAGQDASGLEHAIRAHHDGPVDVLPEVGDASAVRAILRESSPVETVYWLAGLDSRVDDLCGADRIDRSYERSTLGLFRCVKALLEAGYEERDLRLSVVVCQTQRTASGEVVDPGAAGVIGLCQSLARECPRWTVTVVDVDRGLLAGPSAAPDDLLARLIREPKDVDAGVIVYRGSRRLVRDVRPVTLREHAPSRVREGGVVVIAGGAGGLGVTITEALITRHQAQVVWLGRRPLDAGIRAQINRLGELGPRPRYIQADIADRAQMEEVRELLTHGGQRIQGVVHAALALNDRSLRRMDEGRFDDTARAKIRGTVVLTETLGRVAEDWVCFFSSVQSLIGAAGQANYAAGSTFEDTYAAAIRPSLRAAVHIINWGYWGEVGVAADDQSRARMAQQGIGSISRREGVDAFFRTLDNGVDQLVVFKRASAPRVTESQRGPNPVAQIVAEALKIPVSRITPASRLESLGVDSILSVVLTDKLEEVFGRLPRTLVFEYQTIEALSGYFAEHHAERWQALQPAPEQLSAAPIDVPAPRPVPARRSAGDADAIAIIGISGRYPGASNLRALWKNLRAGADAITEIPKDRWAADDYYDASPTPAAGRARSKWGGFIADADKFDPLFFNIAPAEADLLDPQERLFLQTVWETMENAGYTRQRLSALQASSGQGIGVFVGAMYQLYPWVAPTPVTSTVSYWSIANRVSYFFDFQGPSIAVDTACSSSTVALHMACESLRRGEVVCAFAGGVNLTLHPNKYLALQGAGMLGSEPVSRCLGHGDGFVPGEGVGAVLLKTLAQAEADGDIIHAVITATRVHHAGRGNGYRTPNPVTHAGSIARLLDAAGTSPGGIDYVEVAANGMSLAESIELAALSRVFRTTEPAAPVPIGSVKSNLGHLEAASGMSQVAKVVLQLQHGELIPSLHADPQGAALDITRSPFVVQQSVEEWRRSGDRPRRALINSVGAGGTNAHVVIEEYVPPPQVPVTADAAQALIVLSARTADALMDVVGRLRHHLEDESIRRSIRLRDLAYTLQVGREALGVRLALVSASIEDVIDQLAAVQSGTPVDGFMVRGQAGGDDSGVHALVDGDAGQAFVSALMRDGDLERLARLWVAGADLPWSALCGDGCRRVDLPTYPFERRRCWAVAPPTARVDVVDDGLATGVRRIVADVVKVDPAEIDEDRPLTEYGVESMLSTLIMETVRRRYGSAVSLAAIIEHPTLRALTTYVSAVAGTASSAVLTTPPELVPIQPTGTKPPIFCVHGLVGFAHLYKKLSAALGPDYPVYGLQARGVDSQQAPFADIAAMAAHYVECVQSVQPEGPYFLGGYSSGGVIALEMARQLAAQGASVGRVFLLDTYAPTTQTTEAMEQSIDYALRSVMTANLFLTGTEHPSSWITVDELDGIVPDQHVVHLLQRIAARGIVRLAPDQIYRMLRGSIDVSNSMGEALKGYAPPPYEASPVVWFKATRQFIDEGNALALPPRALNVGDRDAAWRACVPAGLETIELDCDHFGLLDEPAVTRVAEVLAACISGDRVAQPEPPRTPFTVHHGRVSRALVIGGGIAGLVSARVLADHFDQVTILERDRLHDGAGWRKGIPQGNHLHNLLKGGLNVLCDLFPGFDADLVGLGSVPFRVGFDLRQEDEMGLWPQRDFGITHYCQSRPLLEWCLRRRLQQVPNVQIEDDVDSTELFWSKNGARVLGVRVADRDGVVEDYRADLIVNATGRSERLLRQLQERGWTAPEETRIPVDLGYSTCLFEIPDDPARPWKGVYAYSSGAGEGAARQGGSILPIEHNQWIVTLGGRSGSYPPTDIEGFLRFARQLDTPTVYEAIRHARPVSGVVEHFRYPASRLRHFDRLTTMPERLIHIGDVVGSFDPVFGQGMSSAALQAKALGILLAAGGGRPDALHGIERAFARAAATIVQTPWQLAAKSHLERHSDAPHSDGDADRFLALSKRAFDDPEVHRVIIEVFHLMKVYEQLEADAVGPAERLRTGPPIRL